MAESWEKGEEEEGEVGCKMREKCQGYRVTMHKYVYIRISSCLAQKCLSHSVALSVGSAVETTIHVHSESFQYNYGKHSPYNVGLFFGSELTGESQLLKFLSASCVSGCPESEWLLSPNRHLWTL